MNRHSYAGRVASKGRASGVLRRGRVHRSTPARPAVSVIGAIAMTIEQIGALQAASDELGREILEFQIELLEDDVFVADLLARAARLGDARGAIEQVFGEHIEEFAQSPSETFAARAADLIDLRDRLTACFGGEVRQDPNWYEGAILLVDDMPPSQFVEIDWKKARGLATQSGSTGSHVALLARSQAVPMLVGIGDVDASMLDRPALLDATAGRLVINPEPAEVSTGAGMSSLHSVTVTEDEALGPAMLADGSQVKVNLSVNSLAALDEAPPEWFDGIGLVRTELLLPDPADLLNEAAQTAVYRQLFEWAGDRPVTIRLIDAGGDKQIPGFTLPNEPNAFLGVRGARLLARRPDVLRTQYAAVIEAAAERAVRILVPMLTLPEEMAYFRNLLGEIVRERCADPASVKLGMLVETPAAALRIGEFDADFFAIGTNDLIQYTLATSRDSNALELGDEIAPAVLDLIGMIVREAGTKGGDVTLCGDIAASPAQLKQVIDRGVRSIAIPGRFAARFKHFIRHGE
ncbi:MAG TPA: putative PEP-binding protein [Croceibacterium sp.]|nr:putative PEP-binding protein [Croceibacterium sp.]